MRPAVISFYSYKGGVGRTLLAANMAVALAREGKTLLWDMDVEAPGLHHIHALRNQGTIQTGFFDWLLDWQKNKLRPPGAQDLGQFGKLVQPTPFSQLFILPAHGDDADAATLYFGIHWAYLLGGEQPPGRDLFAAARNRPAPPRVSFGGNRASVMLDRWAAAIARHDGERRWRGEGLLLLRLGLIGR